MFSRWITDSGVSRVTRTSGLRSLRTTSAHRVSTDDDTPCAIRARVPMEQGETIIASGAFEPDANGMPKSSSAYRRNGRAEEERRSRPFRRAFMPLGKLPSHTSEARIPHAVFV